MRGFRVGIFAAAAVGMVIATAMAGETKKVEAEGQEVLRLYYSPKSRETKEGQLHLNAVAAALKGTTTSLNVDPRRLNVEDAQESTWLSLMDEAPPLSGRTPSPGFGEACKPLCRQGIVVIVYHRQASDGVKEWWSSPVVLNLDLSPGQEAQPRAKKQIEELVISSRAEVIRLTKAQQSTPSDAVAQRTK